MNIKLRTKRTLLGRWKCNNVPFLGETQVGHSKYHGKNLGLFLRAGRRKPLSKIFYSTFYRVSEC